MERGWRGFPSVRTARSSAGKIEEVAAPSPQPPLEEVEEKVYVAVKEKVKESKANFLWAIENVGRGKSIVLLHVLKPPRKIPIFCKTPVCTVSPEELDDYMLSEKHRVEKCLDVYKSLCSGSMVRMEKVVIEANDVEKGLVEFIAQNGVTKLVMGAAMDKHYSSCRKRKNPKSKKASSVNQLAEPTCQIFFVCKGDLICTREASFDPSQEEQSANASPDSVLSQPSKTTPSPSLQNYPHRSDAAEPTKNSVNSRFFDAQRGKNIAVLPPPVPHSSSSNVWNTSEGMFISSRGSGQLSSAHDEAFDYCVTLSFHKDKGCEAGTRPYSSVLESEENLHFLSKNPEQVDVGSEDVVFVKLKEALKHAANFEKEVDQVTHRSRRVDIDASQALQRKIQKLKEQQDEIHEQIHKANDQNLKVKHFLMELKLKIVESEHVAEVLEKELLNIHSLHHSLREDFNLIQNQRDDANKEAEVLRQKLGKMNASTYGDSNYEFSYLELQQATQNFSNSLKIGEGCFGTVYKGFLRNTTVAIKLLQGKFQGKFHLDQKVAVLSRVRHPNFVTYMGSCSEALALVYEFLHNGSLEDHLAGRNKFASLTWQVRTRIIGEICSALIFLHSHKPHPVIHGNLKASNVLLDANFVSKISDYSNSIVLNQSKTSTDLFLSTHTSTLACIDPEFPTTGQVTKESDVYSFGVIILQLLTGKPPLGICAQVHRAMENDSLHAIIDQSAGDWSLVQAIQLAHLGVRCCQVKRESSPDLLGEVSKLVEPMMKATLLSASPFLFVPLTDDTRHIPPYFLCPIFKEVFKDPHTAADGYTYEEEAIRAWINSGHDTSPMTNLKLSNFKLIPDRTLQSAIRQWYQQQQL